MLRLAKFNDLGSISTLVVKQMLRASALKVKTLFSTLACILVAATTLQAQESLDVQVTKIAEGFDIPWSLDFLPDGAFLVTERDGRLSRVLLDGQSGGQRQMITGLPAITALGQGGLLDVVVARDYQQSHRIYFSYTTEIISGSGAGRDIATTIASALLPPDQTALQDVRQIFQTSAGNLNGRHFGGRIVEAADRALFVSIGDMGQPQQAQNLRSHWGKILRIDPDGRALRSNPFSRRQGVLPEIWSLGHRNPQGLTLASDGTLWASEHGARGGDEVNRLRPGANYGWPVISYGTHYSGRKIGEGTHKRGMEQPVFYWDPSIAPSGMLVHSGTMFPEWRNDLFIGSLKFDLISHISERRMPKEQQIKRSETLRVRDISEAPDGAIWFLSEGNGAVYRMYRP